MVPAPGRWRQTQRQWISECEASLVWRVSSRTARNEQRNPVSGKKKKEREVGEGGVKIKIRRKKRKVPRTV